MEGSPRAPLGPGSLLDRYEIVSHVASGGMGSLWLARITGKHGFKKHVAIKTILPQYAGEALFRTMFLDEAKIASGIVHANVAEVLDLGEKDDILYLVMEWVDGASLEVIASQLARANAPRGERLLPLGVALRIVADTCNGLHAAHELASDTGRPLGVVHRDVSPHNILVAEDGVAKLIDFGIAKAKDRLLGETTLGRTKGKPRYMSPEQAQGWSVDRRTDIWSMGVVLYRIIVGELPFQTEEEFQAVMFRESPAPELPQEVPEAVRAVVRRALAADVKERFSTAREMQRALEQAMASAGIATTTADVGTFFSQSPALRETLAHGRGAARASRALGTATTEPSPVGRPARGDETGDSPPRHDAGTLSSQHESTGIPLTTGTTLSSASAERPAGRGALVPAVLCVAAVAAGVGLWVAERGLSAPVATATEASPLSVASVQVPPTPAPAPDAAPYPTAVALPEAGPREVPDAAPTRGQRFAPSRTPPSAKGSISSGPPEPPSWRKR